MTIRMAVAMSYDDMRYYALTGNNPIKNLAIQPDEDIQIISITNVADNKAPKLFPTIQQNVLQLSFDDTDVNNPDSVAWAKSVGWSNPITPEQAEAIWQFINRAHQSEKPTLLLVNCMAGISRSGAVVEFVRVHFGLDKARFNQLNPQIYPNQYVHQLLTYCSQRN